MKYRYQCYDYLFKKPSCLELKLQFEKQSIKICTHFFLILNNLPKQIASYVTRFCVICLHYSSVSSLPDTGPIKSQWLYWFVDVLQGTGPWHLYAVIQQCDMRKPVCYCGGPLWYKNIFWFFGLLFSAIKSMTLIADFSNTFRNWTPTCTFEFRNALLYHAWYDLVSDWLYPHWLPLFWFLLCVLV